MVLLLKAFHFQLASIAHNTILIMLGKPGSTQVPSITDPKQLMQVPSITDPKQLTQVPSITDPKQLMQVPSITDPKQLMQVPSVGLLTACQIILQKDLIINPHYVYMHMIVILIIYIYIYIYQLTELWQCNHVLLYAFYYIITCNILRVFSLHVFADVTCIPTCI